MGCWELANGDANSETSRDTEAARLTADTYGYFAIYTSPVCFPNAPSNFQPVSPPCDECQANVNYPNAGATQNMACPTTTPTKAPTKTPTAPTKAPTKTPTSPTKAP